MLFKFAYIFLVLFLSCSIDLSAAKTNGLSRIKRISSSSLGYDLRYKVYVPPEYEQLSDLPVIYVTDGPGYINHGKMPKIMTRLIKKNKIKPVIAVFIDPRDPHNISINRRRYEFTCNKKYIHFVKNELVKTIDSNYKTSTAKTDRVILGLSLGGLNAACFGLLATDAFNGIAIQSPVFYRVPQVPDLYKKVNVIPLKIFLSSGTIKDNLEPTRSFHKILKDKGYSLLYKEVEHSHNWKNWKPLLDDILLYFFPVNEIDRAK